MLCGEQIDNWEDGYEKHIDMGREILDLYEMYLWSAECLPYQELIRMLKQESGSSSTLYQIACMIQEFNKER